MTYQEYCDEAKRLKTRCLENLLARVERRDLSETSQLVYANGGLRDLIASLEKKIARLAAATDGTVDFIFEEDPSHLQAVRDLLGE